ncbi:MAG: acyltransferase [Dehalococcoidia bacterium]|jgi:galactoside O-acetyltransferase
MNKGKYNIPGVQTFEFTKIVGIENIKFGHNIIIDDFAFMYATTPMTIGNFVHIACFASLIGGAEITIGDFVAISQGARLLSGTDDFKDWGFGNSTIPLKYRNVKRGPINIGRFCIAGANSVVLPGVTVGEGAMIGANSVVTKDLAPWGIYIGNKRVSERNVEAVLKNYGRFLEEHDQAI